MSDLGSLSECLVDNDPAVRVRARRLRSKALVLSVALETLILAALLVWPLISPGALTAHYIVTPAPPYSGGGAAHHEQPRCIIRMRRRFRPFASPFARPRCIHRRPQAHRRPPTSASMKARAEKDQANRALALASCLEERAIASSSRNRRTPSRLTFGRRE